MFVCVFGINLFRKQEFDVFQDTRIENAVLRRHKHYHRKQPHKENVELTENIVSIEKKEGEGIEIDEENKRIYFESGSEQYRNGDLLLIPTKIPDSEFYVDAVYRVETVNGNVIAFSIPELDDVYSEFEISNTYQAQD